MSCDVHLRPVRPLQTEILRSEFERDALGDTVIQTLAAYAPNLPGFIFHRQVITPLDLEQEYGLTGGNIFHVELALDQILAIRPLLGWALCHSY